MQSFEKLWDIICSVREQCPWDQKQTLESLSLPFLEEAYEVCEAIEIGESEHISEELGDVFFMALLLMRIAQQEGFTTPEKIFDGAANKLITRHPHVFGKSNASSVEDVVSQWEEIKKKEKSTRQSAFDGIPKTLPSPMRLRKILKKGADLGFVPEIPMGDTAHLRLKRLLLEIHAEGADVSMLLDQIATEVETEARTQGL